MAKAKSIETPETIIQDTFWKMVDESGSSFTRATQLPHGVLVEVVHHNENGVAATSTQYLPGCQLEKTDSYLFQIV